MFTVLAVYIAICQYVLVLLYLFSGVSECEIVLMFCRWPPPSPHVHAARVAQEGPCSRYISGSKGWVFYFICFPFYHRPTLLHWPAMCFVLRLPEGIVHLDALSRIFIASTIAAATVAARSLTTASTRHEPGDSRIRRTVPIAWAIKLSENSSLLQGDTFHIYF